MARSLARPALSLLPLSAAEAGLPLSAAEAGLPLSAAEAGLPLSAAEAGLPLSAAEAGLPLSAPHPSHGCVVLGRQRLERAGELLDAGIHRPGLAGAGPQDQRADEADDHR